MSRYLYFSGSGYELKLDGYRMIAFKREGKNATDVVPRMTIVQLGSALPMRDNHRKVEIDADTRRH